MALAFAYPALPVTPAPLGPRQLIPRPCWTPLADAEWPSLRPWLPGGDPQAAPRRGARARDLRRTADAELWVATSSGSCKHLWTGLDKPGTVHRTLSRSARAGMLGPLLVKVAEPAAGGSALLRGFAWWLARAFRRTARIVSSAALALVKNVLGLLDAWPAFPLILPSRDLSKTGCKALRSVHSALQLHTMLLVRATDDDARDARHRAHRTTSRALRAGWRQLRLGVCGNRHQWRLR